MLQCIILLPIMLILKFKINFNADLAIVLTVVLELSYLNTNTILFHLFKDILKFSNFQLPLITSLLTTEDRKYYKSVSQHTGQDCNL